MAGKGRDAGFQMGAEHRTKISNSKIFSRLLDHAEGNLPELSASERDTGLALLKKVMPDLKSVEISGQVEATILRKTVYEAAPDSD